MYSRKRLSLEKYEILKKSNNYNTGAFNCGVFYQINIKHFQITPIKLEY